jgi:hypothetical protein
LPGERIVEYREYLDCGQAADGEGQES